MSDKISCPVCPHHCSLADNQTGICGARIARNGQVVPVDDGILSAIHVDPIEKKPLNHYLPGAGALSLGSFGCNLKCKGCQNDSISQVPVCRARGFKLTPEQIISEAGHHHCPVIAYTYNEPIIWAEFVQKTAAAAHAHGLKNVMVTAGYVAPESRDSLFEHIDAANVDLKGFTEDFYRSWANASLKPVLETLEYLHRKPGFWLEITTLLIPGINDDPDSLKAEFDWIAQKLGPDVPVHLSAFHPAHRAMDIPRTPVETILMAKDLAVQSGLHYIYPGNVPVPSDTRCPGCTNIVIRRFGFQTEISGMQEGICSHCGQKIAGVWN
ncbi:MAG: AmmeMemoRadiSam system radical SAM enzyme [Proteobacteria bacterium]|nr:AmmeMemoRadiSam system radical SAM enzyme [Pseudomonadota bacterium]